MVTLELKSVILRNGQRLDYKTHLCEIIRYVAPLDAQGNPKRGFSESDVSEAEALAEKIEASNGSVDLTSEEAVALASKAERAEFPFSDRAFVQFVSDVKALKGQ
jgi:hypothetical protein